MNTSMQRVCRTCMNPNDKEMHPLFPKTKDYQSFERALFISTGRQIKINDGLPQKICKNCSYFIESIMKFRSQCHSTEKKLLKTFKHKKKSLESPNSKYYKDYDYEHESTEIKKEDDRPMHEIVMEVENLCDDVEKKSNYDRDTDEDGRPCSPDSPINIFEEEEQEDLRKPREAVRAGKRNYRAILEPRKAKDPYICKVCKSSMTTVAGFVRHSMKHLGYDILCEFCGLELNNKFQLLRHHQAKHGMARDNRFPCSFCDFRALDKDMKEAHERRIHTKERPFVCDECGEAFFTKRVLKQHGFMHKPEKPFECDVCSMKFKVRTRLFWHIKTVHMRKNLYKYSCYLCQKLYNNRTSAGKHLMNVHGVHKSQQRKLQRFRREEYDTLD